MSHMLSVADKVKNHSRGLGTTALEVAALMVVLFATVVRSVTTSDIVFGDETSYMQSGLAMIRQGAMPHFSSGALYSSLYAAVSLFLSDAVGIYLATRAISACALVVGVWGASRLLSGPFLAWPTAATAATLPVTYTWPAVSGLAAGLILLSVGLIAKYRNLISYGAGTGLLWLAAAVRPEYVFLAATLSVVTISWSLLTIWRDSRTRSRALQCGLATTAAMALPMLLVMIYGNPLSGSRAWVAFAQHFALRNSLSGEDPWIDAGNATSRSFPGSDSVVSALLQNPLAFVDHLARNMGDLPSATWKNISNYGNGELSVLSVGLLSVTCVSFIGSMLASALSRRARSSHRYRNAPIGRVSPSSKSILGTLFAISVASVIPLVVIFPRDHYLLLPLGLFLVAIAALQKRYGATSVNQVFPLILALLVFCFFLGQTTRAVANRVAFPAPVARSVALLAQTGTQWKIFATDWGAIQSLNVFVPGIRVFTPADLQNDESLIDFFSRVQINAVWVPLDPDIAPELSEFALHGEGFGVGEAQFSPLFLGSRVLTKESHSEHGDEVSGKE